MKKLLSFALVVFAVGSAMAQMVIPGESFAKNPSSFNGRKVSVRNVQVDFSNNMVAAPGAVAPAGPINSVASAPGANGAGTQVVRCNPPRGFSQLDVTFLAAPEFEGCFFMQNAMYSELQRQAGGRAIDIQLTFQGDSRTGYNVTFYKIGK